MLDDRTFGKEELGKYHPDYEDYSELETLVENGELEAFDYIISNAVLNVVPQDTRDNLTVAMGHLLKPGGLKFVNVISKGYNGAVNSNPERVQARSTNGELKYDKKGNPVYVGSVRTQEGDYSEDGNTVDRGHETFVWGSNSVQKVFSTNELIGYLQDALGKGYTITKDSLGMTGVTVTKKSGNGAQYQARDIHWNVITDNVDRKEVTRKIEDIYDGKYNGVNHTFAVLQHTPQVFIDYCDQIGDRTFVMTAKKAFNAMSEIGKHSHKLGVEGLLQVIDKLHTPDYIVYQTFGDNAGHYAAIVTINDNENVVAVDLGDYRDGVNSINNEAGYYNILITTFYPNIEYIDENIFDQRNIVVYDASVDKKYEIPKHVALSGLRSDMQTGISNENIPQTGGVSQQQNQTRTPIYTDREILQLANS